MILGNRKIATVLGAIAQPQNYVAAANMVRVYPDFARSLFRYITGHGSYPCDVSIRTPLGPVRPRLFSYHDMLTVNEIFCRTDYFIGSEVKTIVDLGSNIGISALYFLTRNQHAKCYLFEPNPKNIERLKLTLARFEDRYELSDKAVSDVAGQFEFGIEPTGRYGGLGLTGMPGRIVVDCVTINDVLSEILRKEDFIDILKIDTEGVEIRTVQAIRPNLAQKIGVICLEARPKVALQADFFSQRQYGSVCRLTNKVRARSFASSVATVKTHR